MAEYINVGQSILSDATDNNFNPLPNLDYKYGPYTSTEQCLSTITKKMRSLGLTVGIINGTSIKEYWFKDGIENTNLTEKLVVDSSTSQQGKDNAKFLIQDDEPADHNVIWGDIAGDGEIDPIEYPTLLSISQEVSRISKLVNQHEFGFKRVIEVAPLTSNSKIDLTDFTQIKPDNAEDSTAIPSDTTEDGTEIVNPDFEGYNLPNATSVIVVRVCKDTTIMNAKIDQVLNGEFVYAKTQKKLYLKIDGSFLLINGGTGSKSSISAEDLDGLTSLGLVSPNQSIYRIKVDDTGKLIIYNKQLDTATTAPVGNGITDAGWSYSTTLFLPKLYINSVYCGGNSSKHDYNPCSHNFVELSNLTDDDINLNGLSLQYSAGGTDWKVLPLKGLIKSQSTFLIRGKQCSVLDVNTTRIKVNTFDMEWDMAFNDLNSKFYLTYGTEPCPIINPMSTVNGSLALVTGYIDLVGFAAESGGNGIDAYEVTPYKYLSKSRIMTKYYNMDPVKQATKELSARNNDSDWYYVNLIEEVIDTIDTYVPKASFENKNIFFNKHLISDIASIFNITFGIQATATADKGATRCFNWISKGYRDEYLVYKKLGETSIHRIQSFKEGDGRTDYTLSQYNRIRTESTDGTAFTVHKVIVPNLSAGVYECYISDKDYYHPDNIQYNVKNFEVKQNPTDFTFVQVTDQQGFNADEYEVWNTTANYIYNMALPLAFTMNTGDMTQNGNRLNEWVDYFKGRNILNDYPVEMATVGNNDLCPADIYTLGSGADNSKINSINMDYFYTFELDERNLPIFRLDDKDIYINSLYSFNYGNTHFICMNSEITEITEKDVYGLDTGGQIYAKIKEWLTQDIALDTTSKWRVCFTHEMPFTIMIRDLFVNYFKAGYAPNSINRGGSHLNINSGSLGYWVSTFFQENNVRLVLGGHKHTYSQSHPIEENPLDNMKPIIQVTNATLSSIFGSTMLVNGDTPDTQNYLYPKEWLANNANIIAKHYCGFKLVDKITAPVYVMCQSTGYKHTSNKELPSPDIPWLSPHYFPCTLSSTDLSKVPTQTVNAGQKAPFFIVWKITDTGITGSPYKLNNVFTSKGKYSVNIQSSVNEPVHVPANGDNAINSKDLINIV